MAHSTHRTLGHSEPTPATDHRVPGRSDRGPAEADRKKRLLLDDDQRRLLAVKAHAIGRKALREITTIFMPNTILRWHRKFIAKKFDSSDKRKPGRPRIRQVIVDAIVRFARENPSWGYDRIQGALKSLKYHFSDSTVGKVLNAHGIEPAPDRQRTPAWSSFLNAHWDSIFATDFTTVEVWTRSGLVTFYVLAVMHLKTRRVHLRACRRVRTPRG